MNAPLVWANALDGGIVINSQNYGFCVGNIECHELTDGVYQCDTHDQNLSSSQAQNSYIPLGKWSNGLCIISIFAQNIENIWSTQDTFSDTSIGTEPYPFVRIIKIQV